MKQILFIIAIAIGSQAMSQDIKNNMPQAIEVRDLILSQASAFEGLNMIGITLCDSEIGAVVDFSDSARPVLMEHCVSVGFLNEFYLREAQKNGLSETSINGVYVNLKVIGEIEAQPRMSGSN